MNLLERTAIVLIILSASLAAPLTIFAGLGIAPLFSLVALIPIFFMVRYTQWQVITHLPLMLAVTLLLFWMGCSIFWSLNPLGSLSTWLQLLLMIIGGVSLAWFIGCQEESLLNTLGLITLISLLGTMLLITAELLTEGSIANTLRITLLGKENYLYFPHDMNRAATFIALFAWLPILHFSLNKEQPLLGVILWLSTFALLGHMESLSATLGFFIGGLVFALVWILRFKGIPTVMGLIALTIIIQPFLIPQLNPPALAERFSSIPESAEHRLYIWKFASDYAQEKNVTGWGLNASKHITYDKSAWPREGLDPLPSHPHNFVMQTWLELGGVGIALLINALLAILWAAQLHGWYRSQRAFAAAWWVTYITISSLAYNGWQAWWIGSMLLTAGLGIGLMQPIQQKMMRLRPR